MIFVKKDLIYIVLLLQGKTSKEIAKELCLSYRIIEDWIDTLRIKLHAKNKAYLIVKLLEKSTFNRLMLRDK